MFTGQTWHSHVCKPDLAHVYQPNMAHVCKPSTKRGSNPSMAHVKHAKCEQRDSFCSEQTFTYAGMHCHPCSHGTLAVLTSNHTSGPAQQTHACFPAAPAPAAWPFPARQSGSASLEEPQPAPHSLLAQSACDLQQPHVSQTVFTTNW